MCVNSVDSKIMQKPRSNCLYMGLSLALDSIIIRCGLTVGLTIKYSNVVIKFSNVVILRPSLKY